MPAAWQASGTLLGALTTADVTPVIPAHAVDDILVCLTSNRVITNTCATPSGWTLLHGPTDTTAWRTYAFYKRATSAAETNPLCDWTATSADKYAQVHTIRGALATGSPFAASAITAGTADPGVATGVTTTAASQLVCTIGIGADNLAASMTSVAGTDPAAYTQRHYSTIATGADANGWFFTATRTAVGATGTVSHDFSAAPLAWGIVVAAMLEPAAAAAIPDILKAPRIAPGWNSGRL